MNGTIRRWIAPGGFAARVGWAVAASLIPLAAAEAGPQNVLPGGFFSSSYGVPGFNNGTGFGTASGAIPDSDDNGVQSGEIAWFENHFGLFARVSANSTTNPGFDTAEVRGIFGIDMMIPPQQNLAAGDHVWFELPYHVDGSVRVDWGDNFYNIGSQTFNATNTSIDFVWQSVLNDGVGSSSIQTPEDRHYTGNHLTATISDNVLIEGQIFVGQTFSLTEIADLTVKGNSGLAPDIGFAEGDFLHTATAGPAIVLDNSGHAISNPLILSATGFDFANPIPEPPAGVLLAGGFVAIAGRRRRNKSGPERW